MKKVDMKGLSIFYRLLFSFVGVVVTACLLLGGFYYSYTKKNFEKYATQNLLHNFRDASTYFKEKKHNILKELQILSINPVLDEFIMSSGVETEIAARSVERLFVQALQSSPSYSSLVFMDTYGSEKIKATRSGINRNYRDWQGDNFFNRIESSAPGSFTLDGLHTDEKGTHFFYLAIHKVDGDTGEFGGAVILRVSTKDIVEYISHMEIFGEQGSWILTPYEFEVLHAPPDEKMSFNPRPYMAAEIQPEPLFKSVQNGIFVYEDFSVVSGEPLIRFSMSIDNSVLLRDIKKTLRFLLFVFLFLLPLIAMAAYFLSRHFSRPIIELASSVSRLAKDDLEFRATIRSSGEVQLLVDSFNAMATDLRKTTVSRDYVDNILKSMMDTLIVVSPNGSITRVNKAACTLLAYTEKELIDQPFTEILDPDSVESTAMEDLMHGIDSDREVSYLTKDGNCIPVLFSAAPMTDENENTKAIVCVARDLRFRKKAEEEREKLQVQLLQAQKLESVGQLAAGIAHEINTPSQFISSNLQFLDDSYGDLNTLINMLLTLLKKYRETGGYEAELNEIDNYLEEIDWEFLEEELPLTIKQSTDGIERISKIVLAMKEFSHPGGKDKSPTDLNKIIDNTITVARNEWKYVADLETDFSPELSSVTCLADEMSQVILNILVNAAHAIGLKIGEHPENFQKGKIFISTLSLGESVQIKIEDNGDGIPVAAREKIFDPFFTTKDVGRGTGQGLAISRNVIEQKHGGTLDFETEIGKGTTFIITLPISE